MQLWNGPPRKARQSKIKTHKGEGAQICGISECFHHLQKYKTNGNLFLFK
jgi:hypothetical protein